MITNIMIGLMGPGSSASLTRTYKMHHHIIVMHHWHDGGSLRVVMHHHQRAQTALVRGSSDSLRNAIYIQAHQSAGARRGNHFSKVMHHLALEALPSRWLVSKWCTTSSQFCCHTCADSYSIYCITARRWLQWILHYNGLGGWGLSMASTTGIQCQGPTQTKHLFPIHLTTPLWRLLVSDQCSSVIYVVRRCEMIYGGVGKKGNPRTPFHSNILLSESKTKLVVA